MHQTNDLPNAVLDKLKLRAAPRISAAREGQVDSSDLDNDIRVVKSFEREINSLGWLLGTNHAGEDKTRRAVDVRHMNIRILQSLIQIERPNSTELKVSHLSTLGIHLVEAEDEVAAHAALHGGSLECVHFEADSLVHTTDWTREGSHEKNPLSQSRGRETQNKRRLGKGFGVSGTGTVFTDPLAYSQWNLGLSGFASVARAEMNGALKFSKTRTIVAIVDIGCSIGEDLTVNLRGGLDCDYNGIDDDGNGYVDDCYGWDFIDNDNDPTEGIVFNASQAAKDAYHGTQVTSVIGATTNNEIDISGACLNHCRMVCLRVQSPGTSALSMAAVLRALEYIAKNKIRISNHSYSGPGFIFAEYLAIQKLQELGHIYVTAAGNIHCDIDNGSCGGFIHPAQYNLSNVISVGAMTASGRVAGFSNWGQESVDLFAPGVSIPTLNGPNSTSRAQGTSFSSPMVAAAAALLLSANESRSVDDIKHLILGAATMSRTLAGASVSGGYLNIFRALTAKDVPISFRATSSAGNLGQQNLLIFVFSFLLILIC